MENNKEKEKGNFINKKSIIYIALASVVLIFIAFFLFRGEPIKEEKKNPIKEEKKQVEIKEEVVIDSSVVHQPVIDSTLNELPVDQEQEPVTETRPTYRIDHENNPNNWRLIDVNDPDSSYFAIRNKKTGTQLINRYYTKEKGAEELKKFQKILSK